MLRRSPEPAPPPGLAHRILDHLTAAKTRAWIFRRRLHSGRIEPAEADSHLDQIESQVDEAAALAANLQGQSSPPP